MKAAFVGKAGVEIVERDIPTPSADEILVKNVVAASNPKDWKYVEFMGLEVVGGNDVAGYVEAVGEGVVGFKKGDKVAAFTHMRGGDRSGAYAEYSIAPANTVLHLGPETKFEDAVTLPLAFMTAAIGLLRNVGININDDSSNGSVPSIPTAEDKKTSLVVYGAGSTVGVFVVQLAKILDLFVIGVAGDSSAAAKAYGCDVVLNYRSPSHESELTAAIKEHDVHAAFDAVSEHGSFQRLAYSLDQNGGGHITVLLGVSDEEKESLPKSVTVTRTFVADAHVKDKAADFAKKYYTLAGQWLETGFIKGQKVTVVEGGLEGVGQGLRRLKEGEVSGEKLVYRIADTPGLGEVAV